MTNASRDALLAAAQFIRNGVELGYIRMPDKDTRDPAHDTLRMIEDALASAAAQPEPKGSRDALAALVDSLDESGTSDLSEAMLNARAVLASSAVQPVADPVAWANRTNLASQDTDIPIVAWRFNAEFYDVPLYAAPPSNAADVRDAWVPVSERLPEAGVEVLTWGPMANMHWGIDVVREAGEFFYSSFDTESTHWMPLPIAAAQECGHESCDCRHYCKGKPAQPPALPEREAKYAYDQFVALGGLGTDLEWFFAGWQAALSQEPKAAERVKFIDSGYHGTAEAPKE